MPRFRIDHPDKSNTYAEYGHDHVLGFWTSVFREGRSKPLAILDFVLGRAVSLTDIFEFMIEHGLFTIEQLHDALIFLQDGGRRPSKAVARVVEVVMEFKRAAD